MRALSHQEFMKLIHKSGRLKIYLADEEKVSIRHFELDGDIFRVTTNNRHLWRVTDLDSMYFQHRGWTPYLNYWHAYAEHLRRKANEPSKGKVV